MIQSGKTLDIYTTVSVSRLVECLQKYLHSLHLKDMALQKTITHSSRVHDLCFCKCAADGDREILLVAGEDKKVIIYDMNGGDDTSLPVIGSLVGHQNRHVTH